MTALDHFQGECAFFQKKKSCVKKNWKPSIMNGSYWSIKKLPTMINVLRHKK